jgi:TolB-like protein
VKSFSKILIALIAAFCFLVPALMGCASSTPVRPETAKEPAVPKKIAVMPFEKLASDDGSRVARCPVGGTVFNTCALPQNAEAIIQEFFLQRLEKAGKISVIPPYQTDSVYRKVKIDNEKASATQQLQMVGRALEVDAIVIGYVSCFRERVGYAYSAERPASVTFGIYMIQSSDGDLVWGRTYDKTQQSFSENVLQASTFFSRGLKWVTAAELAEDGVEEMLKTFPGYR